MTDTAASGFTFSPLTPSAFLARSGRVFAGRTAVVDGPRTFTYAEFLDRSRRGAGALRGLGVAPGDRVAVLAANSHLMLECHHAVPMAGAVLVPLNVRLTVPELSWILEHAGASVLVATAEHAEVAAEVSGRTGARLVDAGE